MVHFADHAVWSRTPIVEQTEVASHTFRLRLHADEIALQALPGQFVMLRIAGCDDPLIGRALAIFDRVRDETGKIVGFDLVYVQKGKFTTALSKMKPGQEVEVWGPLGNCFSNEPVDRLIMVAGGVGETPMLCLGREALGSEQFGDRASAYAKSVTLCYGARSAPLLACLDDFQQAGLDLRVSTDDGSAGAKQWVTATLEQVIAECRQQNLSMRIACCGPEPMMKGVAKIAAEQGIRCEVSLETPMACGIGICFTCVAKVVTDDGFDFKRTCVEGPIFDAAHLVW